MLKLKKTEKMLKTQCPFREKSAATGCAICLHCVFCDCCKFLFGIISVWCWCCRSFRWKLFVQFDRQTKKHMTLKLDINICFWNICFAIAFILFSFPNYVKLARCKEQVSFRSDVVVFHHGTWLSTCLRQDCSNKTKK